MRTLVPDPKGKGGWTPPSSTCLAYLFAALMWKGATVARLEWSRCEGEAPPSANTVMYLCRTPHGCRILFAFIRHPPCSTSISNQPTCRTPTPAPTVSGSFAPYPTQSTSNPRLSPPPIPRPALHGQGNQESCLHKGGVPCAVHALCEKLAVLHHQEFGKFRRLKGRH